MPEERKKVLVVEDNPGDARLLKETFQKLTDGEFELIHEAGLQGALGRLSRDKMSFILLDLSLPEASGLETLVRIREVDAETPVIVLTGSTDGELASKSLESGANFFVSKGPSELNSLVRTLRDYVALKSHGI